MARNIKNANELSNISEYEFIRSENLNDINSLGLYLRH